MNKLISITVRGALSLVTLAMVASPLAIAGNSGWYLGGNLGLSKSKIDDARITRSLTGAGFTTTSINDDDRDLGYKVFGGYQFGKYFALEGGYFDLGKFGFTADTNPPGTLSGNIKLKGVNFDAVGILPFTDRFSAFARGGVIYAEAKDSFAGTGSVNVLNSNRNKRERATNYKFGAGLEYDFTEHLGMRAEAERYRINDAVGNKGDIDLFSLGLVYRFGGEKPVVAQSVAASAPVAAAPESRPAVVTPPSKVTFSADSLFDFDKSTVRPAGKKTLDKFAADLRETDYKVITVIGHTDRIGSHTYNMKLSTRRAEAVKDYLVNSAGISSSKIAARGTDGSDPVTKLGDCNGPKKGVKASKTLIACLQPDRRVEVEVSVQPESD